MMAKKMTIKDVIDRESLQKFRIEVLRPMKRGSDKRALRKELQAKARKIRQAQRKAAE